MKPTLHFKAVKFATRVITALQDDRLDGLKGDDEIRNHEISDYWENIRAYHSEQITEELNYEGKNNGRSSDRR